MGFDLYATEGTAAALARAGLRAVLVNKIHKDAAGEDANAIGLLRSGKISYIISTSSQGRDPAKDSVQIRRAAVEWNVPCLTSLDTARALARCLLGRYTPYSTELVDLNHMRRKKMVLPFIKMQGCGNDYIFFNCLEQRLAAPESLSVTLSSRHFGIGGDGIVLICPSSKADAAMRMFNLDGSEGAMCGNAIRCVGKYLYENGIIRRERLSIETMSGVRELILFPQNGQVDSVMVDMGPASLHPAQVPVLLPGEKVVDRPVEIGGRNYNITCVSMGNPHCVVFCDYPESLDLQRLGPQFEFAPIFPQRVNTEFVRVQGPAAVQMRVWERGSGETMACGTGACAAAVAAVENGFCKKDADITVKVKGGQLVVRYSEETVLMTGPAHAVYEGVVAI
jgi:carbamoyl-phosphate synthase large subunit